MSLQELSGQISENIVGHYSIIQKLIQNKVLWFTN